MERDYEIIIKTSKEAPMVPKVIDPQAAGDKKTVSCRRCGAWIREAHSRYCSNCGQKIAHYAKGGALGWNQRTSEFMWEKECQE